MQRHSLKIWYSSTCFNKCAYEIKGMFYKNKSNIVGKFIHGKVNTEQLYFIWKINSLKKHTQSTTVSVKPNISDQ